MSGDNPLDSLQAWLGPLPNSLHRGSKLFVFYFWGHGGQSRKFSQPPRVVAQTEELEAMEQHLLGYLEARSFCSSGCQEKAPGQGLWVQCLVLLLAPDGGQE